MSNQSTFDEAQLAKVLTHPLRLELLKALQAEGTASPSRLAEIVDAPLGNVSYHTRILANVGAVKLVRKVQRRGAVEHIYKPLVNVSLKVKRIEE